jgi:hypothetical protein
VVAVVAPVLVLAAVVVAVLLASHRPSRLSVDVEGDCLVVRIGGWDAVFALCRTLRLPLASIEGVAVAPRHLVPQTGLRLPGTSIPGILRAGFYGRGRDRDFWLVRRASQVLVIELVPGAAYRRVVLELPDPRADALRLRPAAGAYTGTFGPRQPG